MGQEKGPMFIPRALKIMIVLSQAHSKSTIDYTKYIVVTCCKKR